MTAGSAQLSWSPITASDGSSVTYQVYGSHGAISTVTGTVYNLTGLEPDTEYTFQVKAVHSSGAVSVLSESVSFKTSIDLPALQNGLQRFIASGKVTHPLAKQLENVLSQAESHVQKGQQDQAAKKIEDFIKHLNNKALQELASADARQWLNDKAEALLRVWGR